jgi:hypothetical protein
MDREIITQLAQQDPKFSQAVDMMEEQLARQPLVPEDIDDIIQVLEAMLQNPDQYEKFLAAAIADEEIDPDMFPPQFDVTFIVSLLAALYGLQDRMGERGYARGGLAVAARRLADAGRGGDTQLAHINRREAEMLRRAGGSGVINPETGLPEYGIKWKSILGAVLPIALSIFLPGVGTAIGAALGASGTMASALGSAVIGGASGALTGGGLKGALTGAALGGIGGGFGQMAGGALSEGLGLGLSNTMQGVLGGGLLGAGAGALTGGGKGALMGALTGGLGSGLNAYMSGGSGGSGGSDFMQADYDQLVSQGLASPGQNLSGAGNATSNLGTDYMKADYDQLVSQGLAEPGQNIGGSPLTNIAKATASGANAPATTSPSKSIIDSMKSGLSNLFGGTSTPDAAAAAGDAASGFKFGDILKYAPLALTAGSLLSGPSEIKEAVATLSPDQQEYFNRPSISWDWGKLQADANNSDMSLQQFMANNWDSITKGAYNAKPTAVAQTQTDTAQMAKGGLSQVAYLARGAGTGRSDEIPARLSDGEYVMDAETVAMIGDGSTDAGAKRLDKMRSDLRKHKGKSLAKGKFSPDAKSPLSYLKGVA